MLISLGRMSPELQRLAAIESDLAQVKMRNQMVETDKAWERSWLRRGLIATITFVAASILLALIGNEHFFRNAVVPVLGYLLSTWSVPSVKRIWMRRRGI